MAKRNNTKKARIGDIIEIATPVGLGYVQYTHEINMKRGELVRVLPGLYDSRPNDFVALAGQKELYFVFYIMNYSLRAGWAEVVSNQPIPEWAKEPPMMRHAAAFDDFRRVTRWRIINALNELTLDELIRTPLHTELTPEQEKLSIREIWPHKAMVRELARGWTPERAEELRLQDYVISAQPCAGLAPESKLCSALIKHYLYFPKKSNAEQAKKHLDKLGFSAEIVHCVVNENWSVLAKTSAPKTEEQMDHIRNQMESVAIRFGGLYDGWEAPIGSPPAADIKAKRLVN